MSTLTVISRAGDADRTGFDEQFAALAEGVRRGPYKVGLLPAGVVRKLLAMPMPSAFWLAKRNGRVVGRLAANTSPVHTGVGYVGLFEVDLEDDAVDEVARGLFDAAAQWLAERGAKRIYGPVTFNTWFPYRLRIDQEHTSTSSLPFDRLRVSEGEDGFRVQGGGTDERFAWEPSNPPAYVDLFRACGFVEDETYHSEAVSAIDPIIEANRRGYERALADGYRLRPFDASTFFDRDLAPLHALTMASFAETAYLFEPIPLALFRDLYVPVVERWSLDLAFFIDDARGRPAGFLFAFPDQSTARRYVVWKTLVVSPEHRGRGLSNALMYASTLAARELGIDSGIAALVRSGAQSESYMKKSTLLWRHLYALFRRG